MKKATVMKPARIAWRQEGLLQQFLSVCRLDPP